MTPITSSRTGQWATRQLADYDARQPGSIFAEGVVLNVSEAYELQSAVAELRCRRGDRIIGYKVGCTSPAIRRQLGINHCVFGRLYGPEKHRSGATLSRRAYASLAIEGELAVELSREPAERDFSGDGIPPCVSRVFPVIELHNLVMRGGRPSAGELIANNAIHAGFVAGRGLHPDEACGEPALALYADDQLLGGCDGPSLTGTIRSSLQWLRSTLLEHGIRLSAGQTILTGSILDLIPVNKEGGIRVDAPPFGVVEVKFVA